jgi:hypothetical protein
MRIASGVTDQYVYFVAVDATDFTTRETGLSSFTVYRSRNGAAAAAYTTPTINETSASNMPGVYEILLDEDMTVDAGDETQEFALHITHAGMAPVTRTIELYRPKITAGNTLGVAADGDISGNLNGTVTTVTTLTNLPAITSNWLTATGIAASALDAKGDWNTTVPSNLTAAQIATGVWQDTTAGDFTTASSVGRSVMNGVSLGTGLTVAAVSGAVGSVTGAVGSVTGHTPQTGDSFARIGAPTGASVSADVAAVKTDAAAILVDTSVIGTAGAGLTDLGGMSTAMKAEVNAEVDTGIADYDGPTNAEMTSAFTEIKGATFAATDTLEAIRNRGDAAWGTATGFSTHSAADVWASGTRLLTAGTNIALAKGVGVTGFNDLSAAQVNAEVDTAITDYDPPTNTEMVAAFTEIKGATFAATDTLEAIRNRGDAAWATATGFSTHSAADVATTQMTEAYAALGAVPTPAQILFEMRSWLVEKGVTDTTVTTQKIDGSTTAATYTLDDAIEPTDVTRAS